MRKMVLGCIFLLLTSFCFAEINREKYVDVTCQELSRNEMKYNGKKVVLRNVTEIGFDPADADMIVNVVVQDDSGVCILRLDVFQVQKFVAKPSNDTPVDYYGVFYAKKQKKDYAFIFVDDVVFDDKEETIEDGTLNLRLLYDHFWKTESGSKIAGFMLTEKDKSYIFTISDNTQGVDIMLSGTFAIDIRGKETTITLNQSQVRDHGKVIYEKASIAYKIISVSSNKLVLMNTATGSGLIFTR